MNFLYKQLLLKKKNRPVSFNSSLRQKFTQSVKSILNNNSKVRDMANNEFVNNDSMLTPNNSFSLDFATIAQLNEEKASFVEPKNIDFKYPPSSGFTSEFTNFFKSENSGSTFKYRPLSVTVSLPNTHRTVINSMW